MSSAFLSFDGVDLHFDAVTSEQVTHQATVTEHNVEEGANIADHIRDGLDEITLELCVTNQPIRGINNVYGRDPSYVELLEVEVKQYSLEGRNLDVPKYRPVPVTPGAAIQAIGTAVVDLLSDATVAQLYGKPEAITLSGAANVASFGQKFNAITDTIGLLVKWKKTGVLGSVITPWKTFPSMVILNVGALRTAASGDCAMVNLTLKQVRLVEAKLVSAPVPTEDRGKSKKAKGRQGTTVIGDPDDKKRKKGFITKALGR